MILGVTGGLGCGKTTAARFFADRGFLRLDSDALVRETVLPAPATTAALRSRYGGAVFDAAGAVDRAALGQIVFAQDAEREWLEALTHPPVFELWRKALREQPQANWAVEVPLLFERALENWFDFTVCVACDSASQLTRLEQRGLTRALAGQRISKQLPLARKVELSDFVLWNEGSAPFLQTQVDRVVDSLV
jgi:dephospho-CoA kinase